LKNASGECEYEADSGQTAFQRNDAPYLEVLARVTNIGSFAGKEVLQLYSSAPGGKLGKPARELKAFCKTPLLKPGETTTVRLCVPIADLASFDDLGKICESAWVLEKGKYSFYLGTSVRDTICLDRVLELEKDIVVEDAHSYCAPASLPERLLADGSLEPLPLQENIPPVSVWEGLEKAGIFTPDTRARKGEDLLRDRTQDPVRFVQVADGSADFEGFFDRLSLEDRISLLCGQPNTGVANTFGMGNLPAYGVPSVMTADGPAGLRIQPEVGLTTTAFPCATRLASTWNQELVEEIGRAGGMEVKETNIGVWLTPAMNIHRSPLCGRNFEYYSEDPLLAGKMAAALIRGIQSCKVSACAKHFACNNKETNRFESDSCLSQRALREIYLKAFEIAVKEADPWMIMTSYNIINGIRASENKELITGILRCEWGYQGMITTDWWNHA
jgi:beta-glucosidase